MSTYIIAEVGPNHNGSFDMAMKYIEELSKIGVDAVKFQLASPDAFISKDAFKVKYQKERDDAKSPIEMSKRNQISKESHIKLAKKCSEYGITYLASGFDIDSVRFLNEVIDVPIFKIASGEIFSLDIIDYIASVNKPILLSTGMATFNEIEGSLKLLNQNFPKDITILHCISKYPVPLEQVNLKVMKKLAKRFGYPVGFSDHTEGIESSMIAVALGASVIEKHVTFDKNWKGADHKASATIEEFKHLVTNIRKTEKILGDSKKHFSESEIEIRNSVRKSIVTNRTIMKGEIIQEQDICFKRPGYGFLPIEKNIVVGRKAKHDIEENRIIKKSDLI
ncbi:MAG: N-acetylneuraminate synthase family protein [Bacteroidales bacterium]|jgi:N,N'-diacetyllegionaminate synthase|nr:N-acetylneuraminate synthase family protein [Bacteroidales bacterium]